MTESPTSKYVLAFADRMEAKLAKNRRKGNRDGWINDDPWALWRRIGDEHMQLIRAMENRETAEAIADEAADCANFCMMLADWFLARATPIHTPPEKL